MWISRVTNIYAPTRVTAVASSLTRFCFFVGAGVCVGAGADADVGAGVWAVAAILTAILRRHKYPVAIIKTEMKSNIQFSKATHLPCCKKVDKNRAIAQIISEAAMLTPVHRRLWRSKSAQHARITIGKRIWDTARRINLLLN